MVAMPFLRRRGVMAIDSDMRQPSADAESPAAAAHPDRVASAAETAAMPAAASSVQSLAGSSTAVAAAAVTSAPLSPHPVRGSSLAAPPPDFVRSMSIAEPTDRDGSLEIQEQTPKHRRFSMLRFRNASDPQLSARAKAHAAQPPPLPAAPAPEIIRTAPTVEFEGPQRKQSRISLAGRFRRSGEHDRPPRAANESDGSKSPGRTRTFRRKPQEPIPPMPSLSFDESSRPQSRRQLQLHESSGLAPPPGRMSESSRSDASYPDAAAALGLSPTSEGPSSFFRLPRRRPKKEPEPLFPIAHLPKAGKTSLSVEPSSTNLSLAESDAFDTQQSTLAGSQCTPRNSRPGSPRESSGSPMVSPGLGRRVSKQASPAPALFSAPSNRSGHSSPSRAQFGVRGRSSTISSLGRESLDDHLVPPTTRTSISTGRKSFGDILGLGRVRQNSDLGHGRHGALTPHTPGSTTSKNNSLQLPRESIVIPERLEDETPAKYLARLEGLISRSHIAAALSKNPDAFSAATLRSYMRTLAFFGDPMDMALRKLLMEAELPKETQHIDRCLQAFANRYHECNPGIFSGPDQAYFIAFSLLILHTDVFNKSNKNKMQKADYIKNTNGEGVSDEILECFYDNITYTPFIHVDDDFDLPNKTAKKSRFSTAKPDPAKRATKEPIDPYLLIFEGKLDVLRPNLKDVMELEDHYSYIGTAPSLNLRELQNTFFKTGVLQIVSARSRPDAFMSERTASNPEEAHVGIVDLKVTKVGLLWRKDPKKRRTRSPWQEWGAILTGNQLYFFRDVAWVKSLMHQLDQHLKQGHDGIPIIFKPPLAEFKYDASMSTDRAVALHDKSYKKHKHAFVYVLHGGVEEVLLAEDEQEMNDWLAKLNYAAAFRTSGVRVRGLVGGHYEGQTRRGIRRLGSSDATQSIQTATGEVTIARGRIDHEFAREILAARRELINQWVAGANETLATQEAQLEGQLRNARHLQIQAPIQPKTREQVLLAAGRFSAQLKWSRMEILRLQCHRDILALDLEEELGGGATAPRTLGVGTIAGEPTQVSSPGSEATATERHQKAIAGSPASRDIHLSPPSSKGASDLGSPIDEVFHTPPASMETNSKGSFKASLETTSQAYAEAGAHRKRSFSSQKGSIFSSSTSAAAAGSSSPKGEAAGVAEHRSLLSPEDAIDAEESSLFEHPGPANPLTRVPGSRSSALDTDATNASDPNRSSGTLDKTKARRSLRGTLRDGGGQLSIRRSRKDRDRDSLKSDHSHHLGNRLHRHHVDEAEAGGDGKTGETGLPRSKGSFTVHGKKASVINFGESELSQGGPSTGEEGGSSAGRGRATEGPFAPMSPDERIRARKSSHRASSGPLEPRRNLGSMSKGGMALAVRPSTSGNDEVSGGPSGGGGLRVDDDADDDFHSVLEQRNSTLFPLGENGGAPGDRVVVFSSERRESAASGSTATARSFRELHRKYSSARAASAAVAGGSSLAVLDNDSDAAVSFSEGRRTPLPVVDSEASEDEDDAEEGDEEDEEDDDDDEDPERRARRLRRETQFFTPEPPGTPHSEKVGFEGIGLAPRDGGGNSATRTLKPMAAGARAVDSDDDDDDDDDSSEAVGQDARDGAARQQVQRLPSPAVQPVVA